MQDSHVSMHPKTRNSRGLAHAHDSEEHVAGPRQAGQAERRNRQPLCVDPPAEGGSVPLPEWGPQSSNCLRNHHLRTNWLQHGGPKCAIVCISHACVFQSDNPFMIGAFICHSYFFSFLGRQEHGALESAAVRIH